jgi:hypothetical protein
LRCGQIFNTSASCNFNSDNVCEQCGQNLFEECSHPNKILTKTSSGSEHQWSCPDCGESGTESHTFNDNGLCECGYQCKHRVINYLYNSNNDGTHSITCGKCGATVEAAATCVDNKNPRGICDFCGGPMV